MDRNRLEFYKSLGFKLTPQRLAILEFLENNTSHPSAEDIYNVLKEKFPSLSFATVYNTLEVLVKKGLVKELIIEKGRRRFDTRTIPHHHFICKKCGKIIDIENRYEIEIPEELSCCEVEDYQIVFYGYCDVCKKEVEKKSEEGGV